MALKSLVMFAPLAILLSALLHAWWNVGLRRERDAPAAGLFLFAIGCALILCAAAAEAALFGAPGAGIALSWGLAAGASEACYLLSLSRAMSIGPLAPVYAVSRGLPLLLLWPLSHALLGEAVTTRAVVAVGLLLSGLVALLPNPAGETTTRAGYLWGLATAVFNTTNGLIYKAAIARGAPPLLLSGIALLVAMPVLGWALRPAPLGRLLETFRARPLRLVLEGAALGGSFALATWTMRTSGAAWVMTLRNASIGFAPLVAWESLGERPTRRAVVGVALVLAGAVLLGFTP